MESNEKETPCGARFDESIDINVTGENNQETIDNFINKFREETKGIDSNMLIVKCQVYPTHFFDLVQE